MFELLVCTMDLSASAERPLITSGPRSLSRDNKIQTRKWNGIKMVSSTTTKELKSPKQSQPRDIVRDANPPLSPRLLSVFPPFGAVTAWPWVAPKARCSCCSEPLRRYSSHGGFPPGQWMATGDVCEYPAVFLGARALSLSFLSFFLLSDLEQKACTRTASSSDRFTFSHYSMTISDPAWTHGKISWGSSKVFVLRG